MSEAEKEPKIHVDADWKRRAREEKEQAARLVGEKPGGPEPAARAGREPPPPGAGPGGLPAPSLLTHISQLAAEAAVALGEVPHPVTGQRQVDLELGRYLIDTLAMLEEKTAGNRTPEETEALANTLYRLRLRYVELTGGPEPPRSGAGR